MSPLYPRCTYVPESGIPFPFRGHFAISGNRRTAHVTVVPEVHKCPRERDPVPGKVLLR
jgi:hypothetical protein